MKSYKKVFIYGFLIWLVPFIIAFAFYDKNGDIRIDEYIFKSVMTATGAVVGAFFTFKYFKVVSQDYFKEGLKLGLIWLAINLVIDLVVLVPMSDAVGISDYFLKIGIAYLSIPAMTMLAGKLLESKK